MSFYVVFYTPVVFSAASESLVNEEESQSSPLRYRKMQVDHVQVRNWNMFTERLYQLHLDQIKDVEIKREDSQGGYHGHEDFYTQHNFIEKDSDRLLSRVRWENDNPDRLHSIEVFIYDENDQLILDYASTYLPRYRNAPIQTLINLHSRGEKLQAFRQFDASGARIYEQCRGEFQGKPVFISLEEEEIPRPGQNVFRDNHLQQAYRQCFDDISTTASGYLNPLNLSKY